MGNTVLWVFYDSLSKIQSNPLATEEAQILIFKMRAEHIGRFFIWSTGWKSWQPMRTYLEGDQKYFASTFTVPKRSENTITAQCREVFEKTITNTVTSLRKHEDTKSMSSIKLDEETISRLVRLENYDQNTPIDADEFNWSSVQKSNLDFSKLSKKSFGRREARHEVKIEILLISPKGKIFRSRSENISLSGSLLADTVPFDYYDISFEIVIINNSTKDPNKSRVKMTAKTVGNGLTSRISYHNPTEAQKRDLQNLLEDYLKDNKKKVSKAG